MPLITIIIPVYGVEKYLHRCVDSVLAQTYQNLEIILIDDGSPDNSGKICDEYKEKDSRVRVIHKENGGVSSARNAGLRAAKGEWIVFVDSDDFVDENYVKYLYDNIEDDVDIVISGLRFLTPELTLLKNLVPGNSKISVTDKAFDYCEKDLINFGPYCKLIKKSLTENVFFREDLYLGEDNVFVATVMVKSRKVKYIGECTYNYIVYTNSLAHGTINKKKATDIISQKEVAKLMKANETSYVSIRNRLTFICFASYARSVLETGRNSELTKYVYSLIRDDEIKNMINEPGVDKKTKFKYGFLTHLRLLYDIILQIKEPLVKHYEYDPYKM